MSLQARNALLPLVGIARFMQACEDDDFGVVHLVKHAVRKAAQDHAARLREDGLVLQGITSKYAVAARKARTNSRPSPRPCDSYQCAAS